MRLNRDGFAVYPEGEVQRELTHWPEPEMAVKSAGDGTVPHMQNFLECVKSRREPNASIPSRCRDRAHRPSGEQGVADRNDLESLRRSSAEMERERATANGRK